ncbi:glucose-6-phosphate dehydrogenase [Naasia sp. SYSU D00948]|uniref:glucose-6-phosphate dehydrogenase n=1 Tax=Naasia sp. SYSU D00948 TaxID=2817379 RepID=UPI001B30C333|nr:glucose-6-phosphate dehydrogenase [Naasia sp. SYSU D00948]
MNQQRTLVLFGASGDLTRRLLLPGLGSLLASPQEGDPALAEGLRLLGSARSERELDEWRSDIREGLSEGGALREQAEAVAADAAWVSGDPTEPEDLRRILAEVHGTPILYFALPPGVTEAAIDALRGLELPDDAMLALEKPFGADGDGAAALNRKLARLVPERQIHRVDHFLGQQSVQGLLGLRFGNRLLEPVWNRENIERVEIVFDEELGLEGRAAYYDGAGALVDMLQSHLLQVLAVVAMEPPAAIDEESFRGAIAQVLGATSLWSGAPVLAGTEGPSRRARYTEGRVGGRDLPAYADEEGVDPERGTETLAEIAVGIENRRWAGVPFVLRSGKAIGDPRTGIEVTFRPVDVVPKGLAGEPRPGRLTIGIAPETISLDLVRGGQEEPFRLEQEQLEAEVPERTLTEYGEVLRGILSGDATLSVRGDVVERCWRIVEPVLASWRSGEVPLDEYPAGSSGPQSWR